MHTAPNLTTRLHCELAKLVHWYEPWEVHHDGPQAEFHVSRPNDAVVLWFSTGRQHDEHAALVLGRTVAQAFGARWA